jgi:hypothetical protein
MASHFIARLAEHLVCAELARQRLIATTFTHNIPKYDVLVTDAECRTVPVQVKAASEGWWRTSATDWMVVEFDEDLQTQRILGPTTLVTPNLIWVCVAVGDTRANDQFFIVTECDLQSILIENYARRLQKHDGRRPKNWRSNDCWWGVEHLRLFSENWRLIHERLASTPKPALELPCRGDS